MKPDKLARLNCLFEKALENKVKLLEKRELADLYNEFINHGRDNIEGNMVAFPLGVRRTAS